MLLASVNMPGPIPSLPNFKRTVANSGSGRVPPNGNELVFEFELVRVFVFLLPEKNSGDSPAIIAMMPAPTPNKGINKIKRIHLGNLMFFGNPSTFKWIICAGRPMVGSAKTLLQ
jgi:hypothetical protein